MIRRVTAHRGLRGVTGTMGRRKTFCTRVQNQEGPTRQVSQA